jgi:hypothetical protein
VPIPSGQTSTTIAVTPIDDLKLEPAETVIVILVAERGYGIGPTNSASVTITDNDLPVVTVAASDSDAAEAGLDPGVFTVTRSGGDPAAPLTVIYMTSGTASVGSDYIMLSGSVTIPAGAISATITITPIDDLLLEQAETVEALLVSGANYSIGTPSSATVTIADDDLPVVSIVASDSSAAESGPAPSAFTVTRSSGDPSLPVIVSYTVGGTATAGADYVALSGSVTILAGQASATIIITPIDDQVHESAETVLVTLASGTGYSVGTPSGASLTIIDDDPSDSAPKVKIYLPLVKP